MKVAELMSVVRGKSYLRNFKMIDPIPGQLAYWLPWLLLALLYVPPGSHINPHRKGPVFWWDHLKSSCWLAYIWYGDWLLSCKLGDSASQEMWSLCPLLTERTLNFLWGMSHKLLTCVQLPRIVLVCNNGLINSLTLFLSLFCGSTHLRKTVWLLNVAALKKGLIFF